MKIVLQNRGDIIMKVAEGLHQPGDGGVTCRVFKLRARYHRIVGDVLHAGKLPHNLEHTLARRAQTALQHIAHHQRPGVDKRVTRLTLFDFKLEKGVEGLTGGIFAHPLPDLLLVILAHGGNEAKHF